MSFILESKIKHGNRGQGKALENDKSIEAPMKQNITDVGSSKKKILIYFYHFFCVLPYYIE